MQVKFQKAHWCGLGAAAVEDGELGVGLDELRHPLELGTVLLRERQRDRDIAAVADRHRIRSTFANIGAIAFRAAG